MEPNMRGVGIALITPFSEDGSVDFGALEALVERVTAGGADYLVVLGTTAETPTLTADEKEAVVSCVVRKGRQQYGRSGGFDPQNRFYRDRCDPYGHSLL